MRLLVWLALHALALGVAIWLFQDITLTADDKVDFAIQLALTGAIFGVVSSFVNAEGATATGADRAKLIEELVPAEYRQQFAQP